MINVGSFVVKIQEVVRGWTGVFRRAAVAIKGCCGGNFTGVATNSLCIPVRLDSCLVAVCNQPGFLHDFKLPTSGMRNRYF